MSTAKIRWDEENLQQNEVIKQQLNPQRIDEPKTPYVHTIEPDDDNADGGAWMVYHESKQLVSQLPCSAGLTSQRRPPRRAPRPPCPA